MPVSIKIQPIDRDLVVRLTGSPAERSSMLADFAREKLAEAEDTNAQVLGRVPPHQTYVDGRVGASEDAVRPDGVILYEFELAWEALIWIGQQLQIHSPVGTGRDPHPGLYQQSHTLFADGIEVELGRDVPTADEWVFLNALPYARKIERGLSPQAPDGVYEAVATMANARFGNTIKATYTWRAPEGGALLSYASARTTKDRRVTERERDLRVPAIVVTPR